jgi:hypothetical protein
MVEASVLQVKRYQGWRLLRVREPGNGQTLMLLAESTRHRLPTIAAKQTSLRFSNPRLVFLASPVAQAPRDTSIGPLLRKLFANDYTP